MKALLTLIAVSVAVLLLEAFQLSHVAYVFGVAGVLVAMAFAAGGIELGDVGFTSDFFAGMVSFDRFGSWVSLLMLLTGAIWLLTTQGFFSRGAEKADRLALALFAMCGGLMLCSYQNLTMLFIGIETLSVPLYVLAGSRKGDLRSNEAALKYLLLGAFASAFLLLGVTLVYGATGSFDLAAIQASSRALGSGANVLFTSGTLIILAGLLFKVSVVPFHFWAPDVYEGSPTEITAFMATVVKMAAIAGFWRLFGTGAFAASALAWGPALSVCVMLTLLVGNITAAVQTSVKRLLAFSSVAHAGFLLLAVVSLQGQVVGFYAFSYALASLLAFGVVGVVAGGAGTLASFNGLAKRSPLLAGTFTVALVSLAGIPPTSGFFGKYYALLAAFESGHAALAIVGIVGSLVGIYYYFRIIVAMYLREADESVTIPALTMGEKPMFVVLACLVLMLGIKPDWVLDLVADDAAVPVAALSAEP